MSLSTSTRTRSPMTRFPIGAAAGWRPSAKALATIWPQAVLRPPVMTQPASPNGTAARMCQPRHIACAGLIGIGSILSTSPATHTPTAKSGAACCGICARLRARRPPNAGVGEQLLPPPAATLVDAGKALLDADANLYDSAHEQTIRQALIARVLALPAPRLIGPDGGETLKPGALAQLSWQAGSNLPVTYDVQVSLDADAVGTRQDRFDGSRLPEGYTSFGNEPWRIEDGVAQAGAIDHSQSSSLVLSVDVAQPGQLSFRYRVSSEQGWDAFEFLVDGRPYLVSSGEVDWTEHQTPLAAGQHELTWRFRAGCHAGQRAESRWLDDVRSRMPAWPNGRMSR